MFVKRKKFKEEITPTKRLSDRWDQKVFFITKKFPQSETEIKAIADSHSKKEGSAFTPSEAALLDLENLYTDLASLSL